MTSFSLHSHQFHSFLPKLYTTAIQGGTSTCGFCEGRKLRFAGGQKKPWMNGVCLVFLFWFGWFGWWVGWLGWVGFGLVCLFGFACLCKQITWLVAYLYPTQKHQLFGNCFGFHWVKMAWILMSSAGRLWKSISKQSTLPRGFKSLPLAPQ